MQKESVSGSRTGKDVDPDEGYSVKFNGTVPTVVQAEEPPEEPARAGSAASAPTSVRWSSSPGGGRKARHSGARG